MPISKEQLLSIKGDKRVFVETGTSTGAGVHAALDAGFEVINTVEASQEYFNGVLGAFGVSMRSTIGGFPCGIKGLTFFHHGDSAEFLKWFLSQLPDSGCILFFLDAHFSKEDSHNDNPLLRELAAIKESGQRNHTIVVDDMRLWTRKNTWEGGAIDFENEDVIKAVLAINPAYQLSFLDSGERGEHKDDILVARVQP